MTDDLLKNFKCYTSLISELTETIAKYTSKHPDLKCMVYIQNDTESISYGNVKDAEVVALLNSQIKSRTTSTASVSDYYDIAST